MCGGVGVWMCVGVCVCERKRVGMIECVCMFLCVNFVTHVSDYLEGYIILTLG